MSASAIASSVAAFALDVEPIWSARCTLNSSAQICRHQLAWAAVQQGLRDCQLGGWDQVTQRFTDPFDPPYEAAVPAVATGLLRVNRLTAPLVAVGIAAGAALSAVFASPQIAAASVAAFIASEIVDALIYTRLRRRSRLRAVAVSNAGGLVIDSVLFVPLAFGSFTAVSGQIVGKTVATLLTLAALQVTAVLPLAVLAHAEGLEPHTRWLRASGLRCRPVSWAVAQVRTEPVAEDG